MYLVRPTTYVVRAVRPVVVGVLTCGYCESSSAAGSYNFTQVGVITCIHEKFQEDSFSTELEVRTPTTWTILQ